MSTKAQRAAAAALLGRKRSPAKAAAARVNGQRGGRPSQYRQTARGLERRVAGAWRLVPRPYDAAARQFLQRQRQTPKE